MQKIDQGLLTPKGRTTYRNIMESAARCVADLGIERTSVTAIAQKAGVSRSLVAHYLPSQNDLLLTIMHHISNVGTEMVTPQDGTQSGEDQLLFSVQSNFSFFEKFPHYFSCQLLLYSSSAIREDCRKLNRTIYESFIGRITGYLELSATEKKIEVKKEAIQRFAEQTYSNVDGAMVVYLFMLSQAEREDYRKRFMNRVQKDLRFFFFNQSLSELD